MAKDKVIIKLDGTVSIEDFRTVINGLTDLLSALTAETDIDAAVDWLVSDLGVGSAVITSRGSFANADGQATVEAVVEKYANIARSANKGEIDAYSDPVREALITITRVVNGKIPRLLMGTSDDPEIGRIEQPLEDIAYTKRPQAQPRPYARAAVKGQIVTLDEKHALYFTLQESHTQRHIRCWPGKEHRAIFGKYWSAKSWIIVEGTYMRFGENPSLSQITDIVELPAAEKGGWRQAIGAAPRGADAKKSHRRKRCGR